MSQRNIDDDEEYQALFAKLWELAAAWEDEANQAVMPDGRASTWERGNRSALRYCKTQLEALLKGGRDD